MPRRPTRSATALVVLLPVLLSVLLPVPRTSSAPEPAAHQARSDAASIPARARHERPVRATYLATVADDFVVEVWHNGRRVPDQRRHLLAEVFGATCERVDVPARAGDWFVFHVVNDRLRWGGAKFFAVAGCLARGEFTFVSDPASPHWSVCDDPADVRRFVARRDAGTEVRASPIAVVWQEGFRVLADHVDPASTVHRSGAAPRRAGSSCWSNDRRPEMPPPDALPRTPAPDACPGRLPRTPCPDDRPPDDRAPLASAARLLYLPRPLTRAMGWHRIVLGIGNPGPEYENTRHNVGFMVLDAVAERMGLAFERLERRADDGSRTFSGKVKARVCEGRSKGRTFLLAKPLTYVNLSGDVAAPLLRHAQRTPDALFVVVDDLNLPLGRIRVRPSGSAGGHNGLESIEQRLASQAYPRLRLGIGPCAHEGSGAEGVKSADWPDFVLAPFLPEEREVLGRTVGRAADCVIAWLGGADLQSLMGTYNGDPVDAPRKTTRGDGQGSGARE